MQRVVHLCWFGKEEMDGLTRRSLASVSKHLGNWEMQMWSEEKLPPMSEGNEKYLENALSGGYWANASNLVRVLVMKHYSGIYLDTDVDVYEDFDKWVDRMGEAEAMVGWEDGNYVNSAILVGEKGCWLWDAMIEDMGLFPKEIEFKFMIHGRPRRSVEVIDGRELSNRSGPWILSRHLFEAGMRLELAKRDQVVKGVRVVPTDVFYPMPFHGRHQDPKLFVKPETLAMHRWAGSWLSPEWK